MSIPFPSRPCPAALLVAWAVLPLFTCPPSRAADAPRKAAIFVENRAEAALNAKKATLEDYLAARVAGRGFAVVSRDSTASALSKTSTLEKVLEDGASALRLAQNLGADCLIVASIASFGTEKKTFDDGALKTVNLVHTLRVSGKVLDAVQGAAWAGDIVKVSRTTRFTGNSDTQSTEVLNDLLDEAAAKIAGTLNKPLTDAAARAALSAKAGQVEFTVACGVQDSTQLPLSIPDVRVKPDGTVQVGKERLEIEAADVTVELDGVVIGSAPGAFKAAPGLHTLRLTREGFRPWERNINVVAGQKLKVALQMSDAAYARWKDNTVFLQALEDGKKLTDANVKVAEGFAQKLRQSGYRVDAKSDVEIKGKSLYDGATFETGIFKRIK